MANHTDQEPCRSYVHCIDASIGGGSNGDQTVTSFAGLYLRAEQAPDQPATFVIGVELGGPEYWIHLTAPELQVALGYADTLLQQAA